MAESFYDPNLMAEQQRNATQSTAGFDAFIKERREQRAQYDKSKQEREQMIAAAEGLAEHFAPQGESAPAYIAKFLKKAESGGGVQQLSSQDIGKFLGMHQTVAKQQEFESGQADKASSIALRGAQIDASRASIPHTQAQTRSLAGEETRKQAEYDRAQVLNKFLSETQGADIGTPTKTVTTPTGVGIEKPRFKDPRTGETVEIDQSSYSEMGLDENGRVVDKDVFTYVSSLGAEELSTIIGHHLAPSAEVNLNKEIDASRPRWKDVIGLEPEVIFDKGGSRKNIVGPNGQTVPEKPFTQNIESLLKVVNNNPRLFPTGVPRTYKGRNITQGYSWTGNGRKTTLTAPEVDTLQDFVIDKLREGGYEDLANVGTLIKGHREIAKVNDTNALQSEKKMFTETVEQRIDDEAALASIRYDQVAARWRAQGLPPPLPKAAYIAASVPDLTKVVPMLDLSGRPTGQYKTYVKVGDTWKDATVEKGTEASDKEAWINTEARGKDNMLNFSGQYGNIAVSGRATAFDEKGVRELSETLNDMDAFNEAMDTLKTLYESKSFIDRVNPASGVRAQIKGLIARNQPLIRKIILGTGVVTEPDQARLNQLFRDPDSFETWFNDAANVAEFEAIKGVMEQKAVALLNMHKVVQPNGQRGFMITGNNSKGRGKALELLAVHQQGYKLTPADIAVIKKHNPAFGQ
jgi:hypothetical protein